MVGPHLNIMLCSVIHTNTASGNYNKNLLTISKDLKRHLSANTYYGVRKTLCNQDKWDPKGIQNPQL